MSLSRMPLPPPDNEPQVTDLGLKVLGVVQNKTQGKKLCLTDPLLREVNEVTLQTTGKHKNNTDRNISAQHLIRKPRTKTGWRHVSLGSSVLQQVWTMFPVQPKEPSVPSRWAQDISQSTWPLMHPSVKTPAYRFSYFETPRGGKKTTDHRTRNRTDPDKEGSLHLPTSQVIRHSTWWGSLGNFTDNAPIVRVWDNPPRKDQQPCMR